MQLLYILGSMEVSSVVVGSLLRIVGGLPSLVGEDSASIKGNRCVVTADRG